MVARIGTLGNLLPIIPETAHSVKKNDRFTFQEAPNKRWAFANSRRARFRTWSIDIDIMTPAEVGALEEMTEDAWGLGYFSFIPCDAHDNNVLTPAQSLLEGTANGGVVDAVSGKSPKSIVGGSSTVVADTVPVVAGLPLSVAVEAAGATKLTVSLKNATGGTVYTKSVDAVGTLMQKVALTVDSVPATARYATITAAGFTSLARPQAAWVKKLPEWCTGRGASKVVVNNGGGDGIITSKYFAGSVEIVEVG